jgi:hypothetical protein
MGTFHIVFQTITNIVLLVGVVYVISFVRRVERDRQHRFRSPVAAIKGLADVGVDEADGDDARRLRAISALAQDALAEIGDRRPPEKQPVSQSKSQPQPQPR